MNNYYTLIYSVVCILFLTMFTFDLEMLVIFWNNKSWKVKISDNRHTMKDLVEWKLN